LILVAILSTPSRTGPGKGPWKWSRGVESKPARRGIRYITGAGAFFLCREPHDAGAGRLGRNEWGRPFVWGGSSAGSAPMNGKVTPDFRIGGLGLSASGGRGGTNSNCPRTWSASRCQYWVSSADDPPSDLFWMAEDVGAAFSLRSPAAL